MSHEDEAPPGTQIVRLAGVPIRVTAGSLVLAVAFILFYSSVLAARFPSLGGSRLPVAALFAAILGLSVLLHEAGHAVAGHWFGLRVRWIALDGIGGETAFDRDAATPGASALVAAAGPAVSAGLAALFGAFAGASTIGSMTHLVLAQLALGNAIIAAFNLLPGLPLDGGFLLRGLIWRLTGSMRTGTVCSAVLGLLMAAAILLVPLGMIANTGARPGVLGIAVLILLAAPMASGAWSALREEHETRPADDASVQPEPPVGPRTQLM